LALDAELNGKRNCPGSAERESRPKGRNHDTIVVYADVGVKQNRRSLLCKRSGGNGEKGARLQTRHYKSVKERRQERREGGLKSAAEAEHTPLTEEKKILPGLVQGRRRSQRRGGAEKKKILQENAPGSSGYAEDKFRPATTEAREERSVHGYGALAAGTPRSAMLSPFLREGTALTWRTTAETGARGSAMSLPV
jgi:hypothetical protein